MNNINLHVVRQFNSQSGPVKAKFAYLCTNSCCRLRNTVLMKQCNSSDDGATARHSLENYFPEYLAVTFSCCVGSLLPIFTQNLVFILCTRFLPLIFPPTAYHGHVLLPQLLGNERLIWSVAHVNTSWNMSKHA
jgi:hypothetical protein